MDEKVSSFYVANLSIRRMVRYNSNSYTHLSQSTQQKKDLFLFGFFHIHGMCLENTRYDEYDR